MDLRFREIFLYITSPELQEKILLVKIFFIGISALLTIYIFYILKVTTWWAAMFGRSAEEFKRYKASGSRALEKRWKKIAKRMSKNVPSEAKLAILEADKMLDDVLTRLAFQGDSLGEKMEKLTPDYVSNIDALWEAHKIRNNIVHDPNYHLPLQEARKALEKYEQAFRDLEIIR